MTSFLPANLTIKNFDVFPRRPYLRMAPHVRDFGVKRRSTIRHKVFEQSWRKVVCSNLADDPQLAGCKLGRCVASPDHEGLPSTSN